MPSPLLTYPESSSESSESDDDLGRVCEEEFAQLFDIPKRIPKATGYVVNVVRMYSDKEFRRNFRLPRMSSYALIERFSQSSFYPSNQRHGGSPAKTAEEHILSFLWYAANKASMREVSVLFDMAESTLLAIINRVLDFMCSVAPGVIYFPKNKESVAREFEKVAGFPNVLGCIDGTCIPMRCPNNKVRSTYINRHHQVALTMQGICDNNGRFQDVFTGIPSKIHDSRVLRLSTVNVDLPTICNINQYHLLGDAAYSIREHLLTPYKDYGVMTEAQMFYNKCDCSTRVIIENAFGRLKQRFRQLRYIEFQTVDKITQFIIACCTVHNICRDDGDINVDDILTDDDLQERQQDIAEHLLFQEEELKKVSQLVLTQRESALRRLGELKRDNIAQRLSVLMPA
ncbi:putative nuclease HARBI1 [Rhipicephalus sanguineus]|uniref:putative nuclease HARBI1 n=1 Tax=Rhipicephalus sanguineus TaxID=34632 RepID=UPI001894884E|nr:putative nuclease HARBI1 [Rhipicephalus sanguineus]